MGEAANSASPIFVKRNCPNTTTMVNLLNASGKFKFNGFAHNGLNLAPSRPHFQDGNWHTEIIEFDDCVAEVRLGFHATKESLEEVARHPYLAHHPYYSKGYKVDVFKGNRLIKQYPYAEFGLRQHAKDTMDRCLRKRQPLMIQVFCRKGQKMLCNFLGTSC